jgi:hypothetical protein
MSDAEPPAGKPGAQSPTPSSQIPAQSPRLDPIHKGGSPDPARPQDNINIIKPD